MHFLIIIGGLHGHHANYLEHIAATYLKAGHLVTVSVLESSVQDPVIEHLRTNYGGMFEIISMSDIEFDTAMLEFNPALLRTSFGSVWRDLLVRNLFGKMYRTVDQERKVDFVFLPYLDYCLFGISLFGSPFGAARWGGIYMQPCFHYSDQIVAPKPKWNTVRRILFIRLLQNKNLSRILTIDELLHRFIVEQHPKWASCLQYLPDPAELKGDHTCASARKFLNIPENAAVVLVYGSISDRKGLDVLIAALMSFVVPKSLHILIVGKQQDSVYDLMNSAEVRMLENDGRLHVINKYVDEITEQMVFAAADIVWLGYRSHFAMSGLLVLAAISGKVVLGSKNGLVGWYTRQRRLGLSIDASNVESVRDALVELSDHSNRIRYKTGRDRSFEDSTWANAENIILRAGEFEQYHTCEPTQRSAYDYNSTTE
jgi:glycosyltransferase involved in cell wall biosynthesis